MGHLPFDAPIEPAPPGHRQAQTAPPGRGKSDPPWTVSAVSATVRTALAQGLPAKLRVIGEVSNFSNRSHWFFSLKDDQATLSCVCFASAARRVGFAMVDGMEVIATGRIDYYDAQGRLQLYVDKIEPVGQGALEMQFRALCDQLRGLGYFDPARKKPLPVMPQRVAVVTSRSAAALQDVINTAAQRWRGCRLMLIDVRVQGDGAAPEIAAAIQALTRDGARLGIDAIVLTRGGGSIEDLWAFNERVVADTIFDCTLPVVAAIGHETDTTIAELVADMRCATPTQAVMTLVPDQAALEHQLTQLTHRLTLLLKRVYEHRRDWFDAAVRHPIFRRPQSMLELPAGRVEALTQRLTAGLPQRFKASCDRLEALARHLESIGPTNVLRRGFTYTLDPSGHVVRSAAVVESGQSITTVFHDGKLVSRVESTSPNTDANAAFYGTPSQAHPKRSRRKPPQGQPPEPGLFG